MLAERCYELKRLGSDEDDAFAESDAFGFDPSDDKKKIRRKYAKRIKNNPVDFQISRQGYFVSANPTKSGGVATTKTSVTSVSTPRPKTKPAVVDVGEELKNIEELFVNGTKKDTPYLPKTTVENIKEDVKNEDAINPVHLSMNKANVADPNGYLEAFSEQFPEFNTVQSYSLLKNIAEKIASNIENLPKNDKDAIEPLSREEVFAALQRSVKDSGARFLTEKMQPPPTDPTLRTACENERKAYREMVAEVTVVPTGASDPVAAFKEVTDKAQGEWEGAFDDAGLLKGKKDILQGWFDLCKEMDALDFGKIIAGKKTGGSAVPSTGVPPPPGFVFGVPRMVPIVADNAVWRKGRGRYALPSKRSKKDAAMPKFEGSASEYGLKIVAGLREIDPKFKQMDDDFQKEMQDVWKRTKPITKDDEDYETLAKRRDEA